MKECKNIYDIKDILYEKFEYWDVEDLAKSIKEIIDAKVEEKSEEIETEYLAEIASAVEERDEAESDADKWHDKYQEALKELDELKEKQDDEKVIPF